MEPDCVEPCVVAGVWETAKVTIMHNDSTAPVTNDLLTID